ncbi:MULTISPECIES: hypothetical protein [Paenibacillus]|uniref:CobQ/CobB/MinD/ParA nucleotide binding domain-containing protein n=1 Tax=Paenibacillus albilobatus TaxID=2716884 RepID=A0A919XJG3_9BACL|nr:MULTISPECIES: hypothetical protein [Paenibacillus]GIO31867.1 hypothetical protein J2TS6_30080 [Paenibacillus albilobatus]
MPYTVVLAVSEPEYLEPLLHYVHASEYGSKLRMVGFTKPEAFLAYMNGENRPDLVVGDRELLSPWLEGGGICSWRVLGLSGGTPQEVAKYQPLPALCEDMLQACFREKARPGSTVQKGEGAVTIGFVSAVGGSGKTTAAANMAKQLGGLGLSVFYLNLEAMNSSAVFSRPDRKAEDAQGLPRLLYEMKAAQETKSVEAVPIGPFAVSHPAMKCDWFEPVLNRNEILQLSKTDVLGLIERIACAGGYDVVIADTDTGMNERTAAVIEGCGHLIWMLLDDRIHMYKSGEQLAFLERSDPEAFDAAMGKSRFIVNRFVGSLANTPPGIIREIDGVLPYIPSWKQNHNEELLLSSPIFQRDILKLCRALLGEDLVKGNGVKAYG